MTFALAALVAAIGGGAAGFINSRIDPMVDQVQAFAASLTATAPAPALQSSPVLQAKAQTVITKKPVAIATLDVQDVSGETNSLIPLALHAEPALQGQDLLLQISGLPDKAYLTSGCLLYTSDAADDLLCVDLGGRRTLNKTKH